MRKLDLDSLEIFKAVADLGGITRAATHLNRVQSNITTRIKNLEQRLEVTLFQRHGGRLTLSNDGEILLAYAERLLALAAEAEAALESGAPRGNLKLGTLESTAASRLPRLLSDYHARYPDVRIALTTGASTALVNRVHRGEVEAAFVAEPYNAGGLSTQLAFTEELVLIAPAAMRRLDYIGHGGHSGNIAHHTIIAFEPGCSYRRILDNFLAASNIVPAQVLELASYHAIVACVAAGSGIAIMPRAVLAAMQAHSQVHVMALPAQFSSAQTHLVWLPGHRSAALDALRAALQQPDAGRAL